MTNEELVDDYQNGNEKAFDILLEDNYGIIHFMMNKYFFRLSNVGFTADEMTNETIYAFWLAVENYNASKGASFATYACNYISWHYGKFIYKHENIHKNQNGEIVQIISLDEPVPGTDNLTVSNTISDADAEVDFEKVFDEISNKTLRADLMDLLNEVLSPQEKDIVLKRYGIGCKSMSQIELSKKYSISNSRISEIERNAMRKLKKSPLTEYLSKKYYIKNVEAHPKTIKQVKTSQVSIDDALNYFGF